MFDTIEFSGDFTQYHTFVVNPSTVELKGTVCSKYGHQLIEKYVCTLLR